MSDTCHLSPCRCVLAVIALAVGLRLTLGLLEPMTTASDAGEYLAMAANVVQGDGLVDRFGNRAFYSPGYPILLAPVFLLTGPKLGAVLVVNLALAAVSVYLVYRVGKSIAGRMPAVPASAADDGSCKSCAFGQCLAAARTPDGVGILAALAWAVYVPGIAMVNLIHKENLMVPLMLGLVWIALAWPNARRRIALAALAGLLFGWLALTGAPGCSVAGLLAVVIWVCDANWRPRLAAAGAFLLAALMVIGPWSYRNYVMLGTPALFTNAGFNLYLCHNPDGDGWYRSIGDTPMAADWGRIRAAEGEAAGDREAARRAFAFMRENPGRTLAMFAKKTVLFWSPPNLSSVDPEPLEKRVARYVWFGQYLVLVCLAVVGLRSIRHTWPLYLAIALYLAIHVPFVFMLRYRLPLMAVLAAGAALPVTRTAPTASKVSGDRCQVSEASDDNRARVP